MKGSDLGGGGLDLEPALPVLFNSEHHPLRPGSFWVMHRLGVEMLPLTALVGVISHHDVGAGSVHLREALWRWLTIFTVFSSR